MIVLSNIFNDLRYNRSVKFIIYLLFNPAVNSIISVDLDFLYLLVYRYLQIQSHLL